MVMVRIDKRSSSNIFKNGIYFSAPGENQWRIIDINGDLYIQQKSSRVWLEKLKLTGAKLTWEGQDITWEGQPVSAP
jgi:hypothetical protein